MFLAGRWRWALFVPLRAWWRRPLDVRLVFRRRPLMLRLRWLDVRRTTLNGRFCTLFARRLRARRPLCVQFGLRVAVINFALVHLLAFAPVEHGVALAHVAII